MIWGLAFLLRELWAGGYVASLCAHMQVEYSKLMPLASLFDLCSSAFEKTEKRQAGPIRRDVWVFFPSPPSTKMAQKTAHAENELNILIVGQLR